MKTTKKGRRESLISELIGLGNERDHAECRIPYIIKELKELNVSRKEIDENDIRELFDEFKYA